MSERQYDPIFSDGNMSKRVTIMDIARDHAARSNCGCSICWAAQMVRKNAAKKAQAEAEQALKERLMKEWP